MNRKLIAALLVVLSASAVAQDADSTGRLAGEGAVNSAAPDKQVHVIASLVQLNISGQRVYGYVLPGLNSGQATLVSVPLGGGSTLIRSTISTDQAKLAKSVTGQVYVDGRAAPITVTFNYGRLNLDGDVFSSGYEFVWGGSAMFVGMGAASGGDLVSLTDAQRGAFVPA